MIKRNTNIIRILPKSYNVIGTTIGRRNIQIQKSNKFNIPASVELSLDLEYDKIGGTSILISAYESHKFIEECLDSIMSQTILKYINYEIIVGVDGCEKTLNKLKDIRHKYPKLRILQMDSNMGTYVTRNTIVDEAKYENLLFFDSDDIMENYMIQYLYNQPIDTYDKIQYRSYKYRNNKKESVTKYAVGSIFIKKDKFLELGGFLDNRFACDREFEKRASFFITTVYINYPVFKYRISENQITNKVKNRSMKRIIWKNKNIKKIYTDEDKKIIPVKNKYVEI